VQKDVTVTNYKFSYQFAGCYADMIQSDPPAYVNGFFNGGVNATHVAGMQRQAMMTKYECLTGCATEWAIIANFDLLHLTCTATRFSMPLGRQRPPSAAG
jgi:hypothetical protein